MTRVALIGIIVEDQAAAEEGGAGGDMDVSTGLRMLCKRWASGFERSTMTERARDEMSTRSWRAMSVDRREISERALAN